ncbi:MAG: hypothetical protein GY815_16225 [Gammaproteobacteria bacterium]|nr:hypothetical protein [Gammaproteobacteria bacterium]
MTDQTNAPDTEGQPLHRYDASMANAIEPHWQKWWEQEDVYRSPGPGDDGFDSSKPKFCTKHCIFLTNFDSYGKSGATERISIANRYYW